MEEKRKRGRPRKNPVVLIAKRKVGRPKKIIDLQKLPKLLKKVEKPIKLLKTEMSKPRGRPRKNPLSTVQVTPSLTVAPKKRGRPKKILTESILPVEKKPRGRPRKDAGSIPPIVPITVVGPTSIVKEEKTKFFQSPQAVFAKHDQILNTPSINFKTSKLLGYCPNCNMFIMESEKHGNKFECLKCGILDDVTKLNKESTIKSERPKTKKEYLENCISLNEDHIESYAPKSTEIEIEKIVDPKIIEKPDEDELPSDNKE